MRELNNQTATAITTTQKPSASAYHCSIRCTSVPKGSALAFSYQPTRVITIG